MTYTTFEESRGSEISLLINKKLDLFRTIYHFFKNESEGKEVTVAFLIDYLKLDFGAVDTWSVLAALDILERSGAIEKTEDAFIMEHDMYVWLY